MACFKISIGAALCAATLASVPAAAQTTSANGTTPSAEHTAHSLFVRGEHLAAKNDWKGAYRAFSRSFSIRPAPDTAADMAYAAGKLGKYADSARAASYALRHMPTSETPAHRRYVEKLLGAAKKHVASVSLGVQPASAAISVDGKSLGSASALGGMLFLAPGHHGIQAAAAGYKPATRDVIAKAGGTQSMKLVLERAAQSAPPMPASGLGTPAQPGDSAAHASPPPARGDTGTPHASTRPLWPALVGGGVAVAGLATGIGFELAASSASKQHHDKLAALGGSVPCGAGTPNASACAEINSLDSKAARDRNIATAGFIVGGVSAIATVTYLLWPRSKAPVVSAQGGLHVAAALQPGFAAIELGGGF